MQQVHLNELDVVDSRLDWRIINERLDMSEELLGVVSVSADDVLSASDMPWEVSGIVFRE